MAEITLKRIQWIDCAKAVAITAVAVDHCNRVIYTNPAIAKASYFSVTLFIFLSGITAWNSSFKSGQVNRGGGGVICRQFLKLRGIGVQYALATFLLQIYYQRFFDLKSYLSYLLNFSIQGPYYFLLIFIQLKLVSPALITWCHICNRRRGAIGWHLGTVASLCWLCSILVRYTFMLPVHGGGKHLLGGTYLLVYYLGILMANLNWFHCSTKMLKGILICSSALWIFWWQVICNDKTAFLDQCVAKYWGKGFNPPSIQYIIFALITLFLLYSLFTLAEQLHAKLIDHMISVFAFLGRYTLYTFMYHLAVRDFMITAFPAIQSNIWLLRLAVFVPMLTFPVIAANGIQRLRAYIEIKYEKIKTTEG